MLGAHIGQGASQLPKQAYSTSRYNHKKEKLFLRTESEALSWTGTWGASGLQEAAGVSMSDQAPPGPEIEKVTVDLQCWATPAFLRLGPCSALMNCLRSAFCCLTLPRVISGSGAGQFRV